MRSAVNSILWKYPNSWHGKIKNHEECWPQVNPSDFSRSTGYFSLLWIKTRWHDFYLQNKNCSLLHVILTANSIKSEKLYHTAVWKYENMFSQQSGFSRTTDDKLTCIIHIYLSKLHCAHFPSLFLTLYPFKNDVHSTSGVSPLAAIKH